MRRRRAAGIRTLVEYFGQAYDRSECGACDWCLKELDPVADSITVARKILSCVARVKQTFGIAHVTDVLMGKATDKVVAAGHAALTTFGLLREESSSAIRGYIEQLVGVGFLQRDGDPYPVLRLTAAGAALMRGDEAACILYREVKPPSSGKRSRSTPREGFATAADSALFDALRAIRLQIARERGVPPYVIFHDTTLRDMAQRRPRTLSDLHEIYGVGVKKAADFGEAFLAAIRASLVDRVRFLQRERRDFYLEMLAAARDHLIRPVHDALRGLETAPRRVLKRFARAEHRLLANHAFALDLFDVAGGVGDDPVTAEELHAFVPFVGDADRVNEAPLLLERLRVIGRVLRLDLDPHVVGHRFRGGLVHRRLIERHV
jgi:hypothetical protein